MSLDTNLTKTELTPSLVLTLLKEDKPKEARNVADTLLQKDTHRTKINSMVYQYIQTLCSNDLKSAEKIIIHFTGTPYHWECWLNKYHN
jgi:hypothetical protein